jgi:hypothetical protein
MPRPAPRLSPLPAFGEAVSDLDDAVRLAVTEPVP